MPQNALAPTPVNALNMSQYESQYKVRPTGNGLTQAVNVNSALIPALMRAHFQDYLANSPATVSTKYPSNSDDTGSFNRWTKEIKMSPHGYNTLNMRDGVGVGGYAATTEDALNALNTMLHESFHARMYPVTGVFKDPTVDLKKALGRNRYYDLMDKIKFSSLPSVHDERLSDAERMNEFLASVVPAQQMRAKNMQTKETKQHLAEYERLVKKYPELQGIVKMWEKPEQMR
jgi:hypothetical protein